MENVPHTICKHSKCFMFCLRCIFVKGHLVSVFQHFCYLDM